MRPECSSGLGECSISIFAEHIQAAQARRHCPHYGQRKERGFLDHKKEMFFANRDDRTIGLSDGGSASAALINQSHFIEEAGLDPLPRETCREL